MTNVMSKDLTLFFCQLLGVEGSALSEALTHKKIVAKGEEVNCFSPPI